MKWRPPRRRPCFEANVVGSSYEGTNTFIQKLIYKSSSLNFNVNSRQIFKFYNIAYYLLRIGKISSENNVYFSRQISWPES